MNNRKGNPHTAEATPSERGPSPPLTAVLDDGEPEPLTTADIELGPESETRATPERVLDPTTTPKTPGPTAASEATRQSKNKSTPISHKGTASGAAMACTNNLSEQGQAIEAHYNSDLKTSTHVEIDQLFRVLLCHAVKDKDHPLTMNRVNAVYDNLLAKVTELCSENVQSSAKSKKIMASIREHMKNYVNAATEKALYEPFVHIANLGQDLCCGLEVDDLMSPQTGDEELIFHVNDYWMAEDRYRSMDGTPYIKHTHRKPDVVVTTFAAARATAPEATSRETYCDEYAGQRPQVPLSWFDSRVTIEVKPTQVLNQKVIPRLFTYKQKPEPSRDRTATDDAHLISAPDLGLLSSHPVRSLVSSAPAPSESVAVAALTPSGRKRKGEDLAPNVSSQRRKTSRSTPKTSNRSQAEPTPPAPAQEEDNDVTAKPRNLKGTAQLAIYGGARLSTSPIITHSINVLLRGRTMYLWYYDGGRILKSTGMDIITDFPFFVLFLSILHRMDCYGFGQHPAFQWIPEVTSGSVPQLRTRSRTVRGPSESTLQLGGKGTWSFTVTDPEGHPQQFAFEPCETPNFLQLLGRGTGVYDVHHVDKAGEPATFCGIPYSALDMVVKIYHPEDARTSEVDILKHVYAEALDQNPAECSRELDPVADISSPTIPSNWYPSNGVSHIMGHAPVLVGYADHPEIFTSYLELVLGSKPLSTRLLRILVFIKLRPLYKLAGDEYFKAWLDCVICHAALWRANIHHRDISIANLMYYRIGDQVHGVLNDYDLSVVNACDRQLANERTGTWPFMAIELLMAESTEELPHIYDYDAESFLWVLLWTTQCYDAGSFLGSTKLAGWTNPNRRIAGFTKTGFLHRGELDLTSSHENLGLLIDEATAIFSARQTTLHAERKKQAQLKKSLKKKKSVNVEAPVTPLPPEPILPSVLAAIETCVDFPEGIKLLFLNVVRHIRTPSAVVNHVLGVDSPVWALLADKHSFGRTAA